MFYIVIVQDENMIPFGICGNSTVTVRITVVHIVNPKVNKIGMKHQHNFTH